MARRSKVHKRRANAGPGRTPPSPPVAPSARLVAAVVDADRRVRETEDACCREHGVLRWQLAAARADRADARGAPAEERALLRQLAEAERELYCTKQALDSARSVLAAHVKGPPAPDRKRQG